MFIRLSDRQYPMTAAQIIAAHPNRSFPIPFEPGDGYALVAEGVRPMFDPTTMKAVEMSPVALPGGGFVSSWRVSALSQQEIAERIATARAKLQAECVAAAQARLDAWAQTRNYDGIQSLCSYVGDPNPTFAEEAARGVLLRSQTWTAMYALLAEVQSGTRPMPGGFADVEGELPELTWATV